MPAPGIGQPDVPGFLQFNVDSVVAASPGIPPSVIFSAGTSFTLTTTVSLAGPAKAILSGETLPVFHHLQNLQTGATLTIAGGTITLPDPIPPVPDPATASATSPPTPAPPIPPGFGSATFRVLTHVHPVSPGIATVVAAFHDGTFIEVIPA